MTVSGGFENISSVLDKDEDSERSQAYACQARKNQSNNSNVPCSQSPTIIHLEASILFVLGVLVLSNGAICSLHVHAKVNWTFRGTPQAPIRPSGQQMHPPRGLDGQAEAVSPVDAALALS